MKVIYSARVEAELKRAFEEGTLRFGPRTAERTLRYVDYILNVTLAAQPRMGRFLPDKNVYRLVLSGAPFIAYYYIHSGETQITVLAIYHRAQQRVEFEAG